MKTVKINGGTTSKCPVCNETLYGDERYCTNCGYDLHSSASSGNNGWVPVEDAVIIGTCSNCGSVLYQGDKYCVMCRTPVPAASASTGYTSDSSDNKAEQDWQPLVRPVLLRLTRKEARNGCRKSVEVDGQSISVDVPANAATRRYVEIPGRGYRDEQTGEIGPLRVCFRVVDR